jgi:DNA primase
MTDRGTSWNPEAVRQYFSAHLAHVRWRGYQGMALCPFHDDSRASLSVNAELAVYYCHACGAQGNVVTFEAERTGIDTRTARRNVAHLESNG